MKKIVPLSHEAVDVATRHRDRLARFAGGNDPVELLEDLQPYEDGSFSGIAHTNPIRFSMALQVSACVALLDVMEREQLLVKERAK